MTVDTTDRTRPDEAGTDVPALVVDPRFRARRIAVRRDAGRKRLKRLLVLIAVAAVALATVIVLRSPILDVDEVAVVGAVRTDDGQIREAVGIDVGTPILLADLDTATAAVASLPWVARVDIGRDLPGTVVVRVVEREPAASVTGAGRTVVVDDTGIVVADTSVPTVRPLVPVVVENAPPAVGERVDAGLVEVIELAERLWAEPAGAVAAVHLAPTLHLRLTLGGVVDFGDGSELDAKLEAFRTVFARVDLTCLDRMDLRVPTHPVLTRADGCP